MHKNYLGTGTVPTYLARYLSRLTSPFTKDWAIGVTITSQSRPTKKTDQRFNEIKCPGLPEQFRTFVSEFESGIYTHLQPDPYPGPFCTRKGTRTPNLLKMTYFFVVENQKK